MGCLNQAWMYDGLSELFVFDIERSEFVVSVDTRLWEGIR